MAKIMNELGEYATIGRREKNGRRNARRMRTGGHIMMVVVLLGAFVLSGCGDDQLFRNFSEQTAQPEAEPDGGAMQPDGDRTQPEDLEAWYESQDEIIAPWTHELDEQTVDDVTIDGDRVSWPLPKYAYMKEWSKNDLLWSPVSDPSRAFLLRVLDIALTDTHIVFQTQKAGLNDVYFKTSIRVETASQELNSGDDSDQDGEYRTRRQASLYQNHLELDGPVGFGFGLPKRRFGFCATTGDSGFKPCQAADTECPTDGDDEKGLCDKPESGPVTGGGVESKPMSAGVSFGTYIEFEPRFEMDIYRMYLVYDVDGYGDENSAPCTCITRYYDVDIDDVADSCSMDVEDVLKWKGECAGETTFVNMEMAGGISVELKNFKWKVNKTTTITKEFQLFESLPIPLGGGIGLTLDVKVPLTFNLETLGEMSWANAANGPRVGTDFGFGAIQPPGPRGRFYKLDTPEENGPSLPTPEVTFGGKVSVSASLEMGAAVKFVGAVGAKVSLGGKVEAGVSGGETVSSGADQSECTPFLKIGATLSAALVADLGFWEDSIVWSLFDTCSHPSGNMWGVDLRAACLSWGGDNLCNDVFADQVRLVRKSLDGGTQITSTGEWADPDGIEIDAIYAERIDSGGDVEIIRATTVTGNDSAAQTIGEVDFEQCSFTNWASSVTTFGTTSGTDMIVNFEEPLQPGDKLHIYRQKFALNAGGRDEDGNVIYCEPSGTFDVYVGQNGQWGEVAGEDLKPDKNSHEVGISLRNFPE
jgi:hypothetical protein